MLRRGRTAVPMTDAPGAARADASSARDFLIGVDDAARAGNSAGASEAR